MTLGFGKCGQTDINTRFMFYKYRWKGSGGYWYTIAIYIYKTWILCVCLSVTSFRSHQKCQGHEILALGLIWTNLKHDEARFFKFGFLTLDHMGTPLKNQNFEYRDSTCFKLDQSRPRAKISWPWHFWWLRKTLTKFYPISSGYLTLDHMGTPFKNQHFEKRFSAC